MIVSNSLTRDDTASRGMPPPPPATSDLSPPATASDLSKREARLRTLPLGLQPTELGRRMWCMVRYRLEKSDALRLMVGPPSSPRFALAAVHCALSASESHGPVHKSSQLWAFGCLNATVLPS